MPATWRTNSMPAPAFNLSNLFFGATPAALPYQTVNTTPSIPAPAATIRGSYYTPGVGADAALTVQQCIDSAAASTGTNVIVVQAGSTIDGGLGNPALRMRTRASATGYIYIVSNRCPELVAANTGQNLGTGGTGPLPAYSETYGSWVNPTDAANMCKVIAPGDTTGSFGLYCPAIYFENAANYYFFIGLEITSLAPTVFTGYLPAGSTTLTVVSVTSGRIPLAAYVVIAQNGVYTDCYITALGTGTGGAGTYTVSLPGTANSGTAGSPVTMTAACPINTLVNIGDTGTMAAITDMPDHVMWNRCYLHPQDMSGVVNGNNAVAHGLYFNTRVFGAVQNRFDNIYHYNADCQAVLVTTATGPGRICNNWIEASTENVFIGALPKPTVSTQMPADITTENNHFYKRLSWIYNRFTGSISGNVLTVSSAPVQGNILAVGQYIQDGKGTNTVVAVNTMILSQSSGTPGGIGTYVLSQSLTVASQVLSARVATTVNVKNHYEHKSGQRCRNRGNFYENQWSDAQDFVHAITVRADAVTPPAYPYQTVTDITFENNNYKNIHALANCSGTDSISATGIGARTRFYNCLIQFADLPNLAPDQKNIQFITGGFPGYTNPTPYDSFICNHCTFIGAMTGYNSILLFAQGTTSPDAANVVFINCIAPQTTNGPYLASGHVPGNVSLGFGVTANGYSLAANVFYGNGAAGQLANNPANNVNDTQANIKFVNFAAGTPAGFALDPALSPYRNTGIDGTGLTNIQNGATPISDGTPIGIINASLIPAA